MTRSFTGIPELREAYRQLGAVRFWLIMLGLLTYIGVGAWLSISLHYPLAYGSTCHSKCMIENYWFSPQLLRHGGLMDYALFAWLWSMPAFVAGVVIWTKLRRRTPSRNPILPSNSSDPE